MVQQLSLFNELKRRNVLRVGFTYLAGSWLLIQIAETLQSIFGLSESIARIVVAVLAIGFVPVLVISWFFDLTPEGLKPEGNSAVVRRGNSAKTTATIDRTIIVLLILGIGYFSVDKFILDPSRDANRIATAAEQARSEALIDSYSDKSIAVLPFADLSESGDQEFFSDGVAEELLNLLARIRELRVTSRSSSFSFRGDRVDIPTIAK